MARVHALLPAAGKGRRLGGETPKQYLEVGGRPLMWHAAMAFLRGDRFASVHVVLAADDPEECESWEGFAGNGKLRLHRAGGETRAESVRNGLRKMDVPPGDWVAVHDAVRPCVSDGLLERMLSGIDEEKHGRVPGLPLHDSLKRVEEGCSAETLQREGRWLAQTPQLFRLGDLLEACSAGGDELPDESAAFERLRRPPAVVLGDPGNIKVTTTADLPLAAAILAARQPA